MIYREIIGGYQVYSDKIVLEKPLGKLKYRLVAGNEIIYDSKDKLYQELYLRLMKKDKK